MTPPSDHPHARHRAWPGDANKMLPFALLDRPLEYLQADHLRQRAMCGEMKRFAAEGTASRDEADGLTAFLTYDLRLNHEDEEEDAFPAIRRRAQAQDELGSVLDCLVDGYRRGEAMAGDIVARLTRNPGEEIVRIDRRTGELMRAYAGTEQRNLAINNGVVLAIARVRLTRQDLQVISSHMKARRVSAPRQECSGRLE